MVTTKFKVENDRRKQQRKSQCRAVTILLPDEAGAQISAEKTSGAFTLIKGWSCNISPDGIRFTCPQKLPENKILIQIDSPPENVDFLEAEIISSHQLQKGAWEYGAKFHKRQTHSPQGE